MARKSNAQKEAEAQALDDRIAAGVMRGMESMREEVRKEILGEVLKAREAAGLPTDINLDQVAKDKSFADALAMSIADIANQGIGKPAPVPPETLERWRTAHREVVALLAEAHVSGEDAHYRVTQTMFLNETRVEPQWNNPKTHAMEDMIIRWNDIPNEWMEPHNELAVKIHAAYMTSIGITTTKRVDVETPWVRSEKRLFLGMSPEDRERQNRGGMDPRLNVGRGPGHATKHILGTVASPAVLS